MTKWGLIGHRATGGEVPHPDLSDRRASGAGRTGVGSTRWYVERQVVCTTKSRTTGSDPSTPRGPRYEVVGGKYGRCRVEDEGHGSLL